MCGIAGFWSPSLTADTTRGVLRRMNDAVKHRGPDGTGEWTAAEGGPSFGHRRLAIVDLSPSGHQPMHSASGRFVTTFNGEVYNFKALRVRLASEGVAPRWKGTSDTEVMLACIEAWGLERAVGEFVGMFAFALWDSQDRRLHLVRDRLGVKPLYRARVGKSVVFGSELKSLRCFPGFGTEIDRAALAGYFRANCVPDGRSIYVGTTPVAPGTILTWSDSATDPVVHRYWDPSAVALRHVREPFHGSDWEAIDEVDRLLRDAVRLRMVADVPLGAFLSGGVDSSTVVALMQAQSDKPVHTFSIENENDAYSEGDTARAVAKHLGTNHTAMVVTARDGLDVIPLLPAMYDEPFADSSQIPTYIVSKLARKDVTVALTGDGGDELFGGYVRHVWGPRILSMEQHLPRQLCSLLANGITRLSPDDWNGLFARLGPLLPRFSIPGIRMHKFASVLMASTPASMYEILASHWLPGDSVLLNPETTAVNSPAAPPPPPVEFEHDSVSYMMYRDLVGYMSHDILTKVDRATMAVSLEAREPLMDHRLVEFAWSLPNRLKVRGTTGKWILRRVLDRYVPLKLITGPKTGFGVSLGNWLRGPLRDWAEPLLAKQRLEQEGYFNAEVVRSRWEEHLNGTRPWEYHLWDVLMFQAWADALS